MKSVFTLTAASALCAALAMAQTPRYAVIDLGTLGGGKSSSFVNYLNDNRVAAGSASAADGAQQAVLWSGPLRIDIGTPGLNSGIFGLNTSGQASINAEVSTKDPYNENFCAFGTGLECAAFQLQHGVLTQLPTLGGNNSTIGNINNRGEIAGATENSTRDPACPTTASFAGNGPQVLDYEAVVWGPNPGDVRELRPLPGDTVGLALSINDHSQAVGASGTCANSALPPIAFGAHAVMWDADGTAHDLGNLGGKVINVALSINNQGQVTGVSSVNDQATLAQGHHAFLWTSAAGMKDLGTLPGDVASVGTVISDAGDVVGESDDASGNARAILWHNGAMNDLNDLAPGSPLFLLCATAINSRGEIGGFGATEKGDIHAYLATPVSATATSESLSAETRPAALADDVRTLVREHLPLRRY